MWAGRFWRLIDIRQKLNLPLTASMQGNGNQAPLWKVLQTAILNHQIPVYRDDAFAEPLTQTEAQRLWERIDTFMLASPEPPYTEKPTPVVSPFDPSGIRFFQIKEEWFFDRHRSQLDVQILGLGLVVNQTDPRSGEELGLANLFWMRFSDIEPLLNAFTCYNPGNLAIPMSYQDVFRNRLFHAMIYKRDNVFDRELADYAQGLDILLEGEEMKKELRNFEEDLWER
jgi:gliding motility associated protien GldN